MLHTATSNYKVFKYMYQSNQSLKLIENYYISIDYIGLTIAKIKTIYNRLYSTNPNLSH